MRQHLRNLTTHAIFAASFLVAPHIVLAAPPAPSAPPATEHRAVITRVPPVYPELAKRMGVTGVVTLRAVVLPDGTVSETHVESGHALLRQSAEDAVRHWRFAPNPNSSDCIVSVGFELPH
jgi:TonB family protein